MTHISRRIYTTVGLASFALVTACTTTATPSQIALVAGDTAMLVADINADIASKALIPGQALTPDQVATAATDTAKLSTDVAALDAGSTETTVATVLADVAKIAAGVEPFLPEIGALVALATPVNAPMPSALAQKAQADYAKLQADAATVR